MCQNNPQTEKMTVWGFTEEEIEHRWEVYFKFDPVNRFCGSSSDSDNRTDSPAKKDNTAYTMGLLENILPRG